MNKLFVLHENKLKTSDHLLVKHDGKIKKVKKLIKKEGDKLTLLWDLPELLEDPIILMHLDNNIVDVVGTLWTNNGVIFEDSHNQAFGQQAVFDNNRFVITTDNKNFFIGAEDDFTFSFWLEPTSLNNSYATIIANGYNSWSAGACFINLWGKNSPNSTLSSKIGLGSRESSYEYGYTSILSNTIIEVGKRYHVAITRSKGTIRLFLNGVLDAERTGNKLVFDFSKYGKTAIGRDYNNPEPSCFLQAKLDEFLFIKKALYIVNFMPPNGPYNYKRLD